MTISGTPLEGEVLTAANTLVDNDGLGVITYQWQSSSNGSVWSAIGSGATFTLAQAQVGLQVRVVASYVDGDGTAESVASAPTSPVANLNTSPTGTVSIDGSAAEDQVLTAVSTLADTDGLGAITYNWQISSGPDWFDVGTGSTLTLSDGHVGHQIRVVASYVDGGGTPESVTSTPTPAVSNGNILTLDDGAILVFGLRGHLFRSDDRGTSWQRLETGTTATLLTGLVRADGSIVIAGIGGVLLLSDDAGGSFELQDRADRHGIAALIELAPNQLLAVGDGGLTESRFAVRQKRPPQMSSYAERLAWWPGSSRRYSALEPWFSRCWPSSPSLSPARRRSFACMPGSRSAFRSRIPT